MRVLCVQDLIVKVVDGEAVSFLLTDPWAPDNPIVHASPAFCRLTQYSLPEILGKSCRFLQGAGTDFLTVRRMGTAALGAGTGGVRVSCRGVCRGSCHCL